MKRVVPLALGLAMALAGCVSVPTSGPVQVVSQRAHTAEPHIDIRPVPPAADADPRAIVSGFLVAMGDSGGDLTTARQYLTADAAGAWHPEHGVIVYDSTTNPHDDESSVTLDGTAMGRVDPNGSYVARRQALHHDFGVVKQNGQWRISNPPDGLLIGTTLFTTNYAPATLYFFDTLQRSLVPDVRYFPKQRITAADLIRADLAGPTDWIGPAVRSAAPPGLRIGNAGIATSANGVVSVSLAQQIMDLGDDARSRLAAQLALTLRRNLPTTTGIVLLHETDRLTLPDSDAGVWRVEQADRYDPLALQTVPDLFAVKDDALVRVSDAGGNPRIEAVTGPFGRPGLGLEAMAVAPDGSEVAAVVGQRDQLLVGPLSGQGSARRLLQEPGLLTPQYSRYGELWVATTAGGATQMRRGVTDALDVVDAPALAGIAVDAFRVSPDGTRMIVLGRKDNAPILGVAQIRRGAAVTIDGWRPLDLTADGTGPTAVAAVGWRSDTQLLLLGSDRETGTVNPYEIDVDAQAVTRGAVTMQGSGLATMPYGRFSAVVLTDDGHLLRRTDTSRWPAYESAASLEFVTYPG